MKMDKEKARGYAQAEKDLETHPEFANPFDYPFDYPDEDIAFHEGYEECLIDNGWMDRDSSFNPDDEDFLSMI